MAMIYIVEDDENIREIEMFALKNAGYEVQGFECAAAFYARLKEKVPALVLLDIMLPDEDGLTIVKKLRHAAETRKLPIIMATAKTTEIDKVKGLDIGADDYITKPFNILEVKARIKAIMRRTAKRKEEPAQSPMLVKGNMKIDCEGRRVFIGEKEINLTAKEFDVLELLAMNPNKVYSRENLLNLIWGYDYPGDARTVDVHIRRLREKIEMNPSEPKYVHTKWGVGYYFQG